MIRNLGDSKGLDFASAGRREKQTSDHQISLVATSAMFVVFA